MSFFTGLSEWTTTRYSWLVLFLSGFALIASALVFQHVFDHQPCVMCIYQRNAVFGLTLAGLLVLLFNHAITRALGYLLWLVSAAWGLKLALEHHDILTAENAFFSPCEIAPNFPSFLPLDDWLPNLFAATGFCEDDRWQFLGAGMAQWMVLIFSIYLIVFVTVITSRLINAKRL